MNESSGRRRRSKEEWLQIVDGYPSRDCTRSEYLERHNISENALQYHLDKRKAKAKSFTSVSTSSSLSSEITFEFPSGIRLQIRN